MMESPRQILRRHGLRPKKSWGQNFLGDLFHLDAIARACGLREGETAVEFGAGLGHLTRQLAFSEAKKIVAVERDRELLPVLQGELAGLDAVEVIEANAKTFDLCAVAEEAGGKVVVVGNLPYQLSTEILFRVDEQRRCVDRAIFLLQREVTERIAASPGGKVYGVVSVLLQLHFDVDIPHRVPRNAFTPPPDVESAVVRLRAREQPRADPGDEARFRVVVRAAFSQRRKTLGNALRTLPESDAEGRAQAFEQAGIDPSRRAETLSVEEFCALSRALSGGEGGR